MGKNFRNENQITKNPVKAAMKDIMKSRNKKSEEDKFLKNPYKS
jgi:hypothetical protein